MKKIFTLLFFLVTANLLYAQGGWEEIPDIVLEDGVQELSQEQLDEFAEQARRMIAQLSDYTKSVTNERVSDALKDSAISNARVLFASPDDNIIQVGFISNWQKDINFFQADSRKQNFLNTVRNYVARSGNKVIEYQPIDGYFRYLKEVAKNYVDFKVASSDIVLRSEGMILGEDGNYYGTAKFCRTFEGTIRGESRLYKQKGRNCYDVKIVIERYRNPIDQVEGWRVRLGDIIVRQPQP